MKSFTDGLNSRPPHTQPYFELVVVGTSLGGLSALELLLKKLPVTFPAAIAIVQHRHKDSDTSLSQFLQSCSVLPLKDAEDKEAIVPGQVYLAPADYHLLVEDVGRFALSTEMPVSYARPSIDVLFESAADAYGARGIGVILTGSGRDGAQGLARIKARGGLAIVQDPKTSESRMMPEAAIATTAVDWILPLADIAPRLIHLCQPVIR
ncbi:chemotaxis protein CheB [Trichocoleus desertorum AS-A10]|uniref:chemotaxis protein CheB n=1 Tax=Trichocoleus desertorum TaxID=1481672 RepID=UPI00329971F5